MENFAKKFKIKNSKKIGVFLFHEKLFKPMGNKGFEVQIF